MCGINGIVNYLYDEQIGNKVKRMNDLILHRGPDDTGIYQELGNPCIALGMRRLSIIDLSTGNQPMYNDDKSCIIVFNGEIYNYRKIKKQLEMEGVIFKTTSDTEVILKAYERYGISSFSMLDGMFVFSIYDKKEKKIIITRDFFGEKPLFYYSTKTEFIWASELKSIINVVGRESLTISKAALNLYLQLTYIPAPYTIYENVFKLEQNMIIEFDIANNLLKQTQILEEDNSLYRGITEKEAVDICFEKVYSSVISRSIADVPLGTFLSGGVDSSIVSWCLAQNAKNKIDTFSIGFENKKFDESENAQVVANLIKSNHHKFIISENDIQNLADKIIINFDEPFADSSALVTYIVANKAASYVKVALTGDGGDELFGGYNKYYIGKINNLFQKVMPEKLFFFFKRLLLPLLNTSIDNRNRRFKLKKMINSIDYENNFYYKIISLGFLDNELKYLFNDDNVNNILHCLNKDKIGESSNTIYNFRQIDKYISLEGDMLTKVDRASMLSSLECRSPFLNRDLWYFSNQLPDNYLVKGTNKKYILKKAFERYFPRHFFDRPKQGFDVPVGDWLRNSLREELVNFTDSDFLTKQGIFNKSFIQNLVYKHINGKEDNTFRVWTFFCFQKWFQYNGRKNEY